MHLRSLSIAILALGGVAAACDALALGFGRIPESVTFGQALDLTVPLRIDPGESPTPGCLQAEVRLGERQLAQGAVLLTLERRGAARDDVRVRIRGVQVVQEPLVAVNLSAGCSGAVSRRFVVFADPPDTRGDVAHLPAAGEAAERPAALAARVQQPVPRPSISGEAASGIGPASAGAARPNGTKTARNGSAEGAGERHLAKPRTPLLAVRGETPRGAAPRLELEEPEELLKAATRTVAAQDAALATAAQAASAAAAAASAADQRVLALATELKSLHDEANTHRATIELMRGRLAQAEDQGRMQSALAALVVALGALLWWLGWRVRALQRERQAAWRQSAAAAQGAAVVAPQAQAAAGSAQVLPAAGVPPPWTAVPDDVAAPPALPSAPLPAVVRVEDTLTRPVSVDELIDLEQQAEFFVVLGDEDAAVDLLMSHLRSTGGTSPLPYLKLLDIYRRRDDRDAYERMRKRFGQRFNAVAPDWEADPEDGRDLLNYPSVLASLQGCWPLPLDAMAELENLLFRKRSGELFELPAYRDVLTLYAVARDLHRRADQPSADVDVLLPLGSGDGFGRAAPPSIFDSLAPRTGDADTPPEYQPTAPVDLDLSEPPAPRDSRVGGLSPLRAGS